MNNKYSFGKGLVKGIISVVVFAVPFVVLQFPTYANLTIGGVLTILVNFLKVKYIK